MYAGTKEILEQWGLDYILNLQGEELKEFASVVEILKDPVLSIQFWVMKILGWKVKDGIKKE